MHNLFSTRPNYRICLGINADFALSETEADARVGTKDPINQINPKYITINKSREIEELHYDGGWDDEKQERTVEMVKVHVRNITFKTKAPFIYNKKEIEQVLEKLYDDLSNKSDKLKDRRKSAGTLKNINYFFFDVYKIKEIRGSSYIPTPENIQILNADS
jgi:hypothetical protein